MRRKLLINALARWGHDAQIRMMLEEMAELTVALLHEKRQKAKTSQVIDELADVYVVLHQMMLIYGEVAVMKKVEEKMNRLEERIKCS